MRKKKAYYTLEATWMFGLTITIFISVILLNIRLYGETYDDIAGREPAKIEAVSEFRKINMAKDLAGQAEIGDREKEE